MVPTQAIARGALLPQGIFVGAAPCARLLVVHKHIARGALRLQIKRTHKPTFAPRPARGC